MKKTLSILAILVMAIAFTQGVSADTMTDHRRQNGGEVKVYKELGAYISNDNNWTGAPEYLNGAVAIEIELIADVYGPMTSSGRAIFKDKVIEKGTYVVCPGHARYFKRTDYKDDVNNMRVKWFKVKPYKVTPEQKKKMITRGGEGSFKLSGETSNITL